MSMTADGPWWCISHEELKKALFQASDGVDVDEILERLKAESEVEDFRPE